MSSKNVCFLPYAIRLVCITFSPKILQLITRITEIALFNCFHIEDA